ncbi:hypothetical protein WN48_07085 [Eufriesea mexicana]|uniref:Uncharacterized protein n=2 Tax=Eufriesea mexicana TaxID=516756 RepID=A0A310SNH1_9HYME|nr:hypothetical protein WN48_07085 [Eufriesea mexicana]
MRALFVILFICFLALPAIMGCRPPGLPCSDDKDCCAPLVCNPWAGRCTKKMSPPAALANQPEDPAAPPVQDRR